MISSQKRLALIKQEIKEKYGVESPTFLIDGNLFTEKAFSVWVKKCEKLSLLWMKYLKIEDDLFELKQFSPDSDDVISMKIIDCFFQSLSKDSKEKWYTVSYSEGDDESVIEGDSWYDESEVKVELQYLLRMGKSKITQWKEPIELKNAIGYHLFVEQDLPENMIKTGYLKLECSE